jgi:hypothetical protein
VEHFNHLEVRSVQLVEFLYSSEAGKEAIGHTFMDLVSKLGTYYSFARFENDRLYFKENMARITAEK